MGAGVALFALGSLKAENAKAPASAPKAPPPQPFTLPPLPYAYDALEPHIDARTMEIHHTKHHQAYIDAANRALAEHPDWMKKTAEELLKDISSAPEGLRLVIRNHVGGHVNHTQFWNILSPKPQRMPSGDLAKAIDRSFGSFDAFRARFIETGMKRFGSGWAWLSLSPAGKLEVHSTPNQDAPAIMGYQGLIGIDVWEHAYYLRYQNLRQSYLEAVWRLINWAEADQRYKLATAAA